VTTALIALGSNLGDRLGHLKAAVTALSALPETSLTAISGLYETAPVGGPDNQGPFLNAAAAIETALPPARLLSALHTIEASRDRERRVRWGPRTLDLDILVYGAQVSDAPELTLPHPRMHERRFVLVPVADIAADLIHPSLGRSMAALLAALPAEDGDLVCVERDWATDLPPADPAR